MSLNDISYKVLIRHKEPLTAKEIWNKAVECGYVKADEHGKTPWASLGRDIYEDIKKGDISRFFKAQPGLFTIKGSVPNEFRPEASGVDNIGALPSEQTEPTIVTVKKMVEADFYQPFADWLVNEVKECTKAIPLGGNRFKDKWGTPDVIGIREPRKSDIIKPATEIVAAEVKLDTAGLITAFGQACSYKLFSHKSYIVVPSDSSEEDIARLDALGRIFGIGLILVDITLQKKPRFEIRVRATKHEPDIIFVNKYVKLIEDELF